jgi:hypothetical protein
MDSDIITILLTILVGLSIGIVIGYLLFKQYNYKGPDSNTISKELYTDSDGKKYKWVPQICICPSSYSMILLKDPNSIELEH